MTENPLSYFDILQGILDQLADGIHLEPEDLTAAFEALDELQRWCDAEATASTINFQKWQEATQQIDELLIQTARLELTLDAQDRALANLTAEF